MTRNYILGPFVNAHIRQYEKGELTLPAMGEQNFEFVNLNEPVFKKSQLWGYRPAVPYG